GSPGGGGRFFWGGARGQAGGFFPGGARGATFGRPGFGGPPPLLGGAPRRRGRGARPGGGAANGGGGAAPPAAHGAAGVAGAGARDPLLARWASSRAGGASSAPGSASGPAFRLGDDLIHAAFGEGVVTGVEPGGVIVVRFAGDGSERKLMADYAPLSRR